jgi:phosphoribosylanthranilate isomerase
MMVKVCGLREYRDVMAALEQGADAIGFNFYGPSPRYLAPERVSEIARELPSSVMRVGIFVNAHRDELLRHIETAKLDVVQWHGDSEHEPGAALGSLPVEVWRALKVHAGFRADEVNGLAFETVLLDSPGPAYGGNGVCFDWAVVRGLEKNVVLAGGLDASNVTKAIEEAQPWGVDACSKIESAPGVKDHEKMGRFILAAKEAAKDAFERAENLRGSEQ